MWAPTWAAAGGRKKSVAGAWREQEGGRDGIHVTLLGGGFGRKVEADFCVGRRSPSPEGWAHRCADAVGTQPDDLGTTITTPSRRSSSLSAAIDKGGKVSAWRHRTAFPPIGSTFADTKAGGEGEMQQKGVTDVPLDIPEYPRRELR